MVEPSDVEGWFASAGGREGVLRGVDRLVTAAAPGLDRQLVPLLLGQGRMLGYGLMPYRPRSARETTTYPLVALAAWARYVALYVSAVAPDGGYLAERYAPRLGKVSVGRSCVRFTDLDRVETGQLSALVREAAETTDVTVGLHGARGRPPAGVSARAVPG